MRTLVCKETPYDSSLILSLTLQVLLDWINDVLVGERIIVKDLAEDLYDGQVLQKLFGKRRVECRSGCL